MKYGTLALIIMFCFSLSGGTASAQSTGALNGTLDATLDSAIGTDDDTGTSSGTGVSGTAGVDIGASADDTGVSSGDRADFSFSIGRDDADQADTGASGRGSVESASAVSSDETLRAYAETAVRNDENLERVEVGSEGLDIRYRQEARILGFIPGHVTVTVHVTNDGSVSVDYPWYSFMAATGTDREALESRIRSDVSAAMDGSGAAMADALLTANASGTGNGTGSAVATGQLSSRVRADILERVHAALSADADASAR